MGRNSNSNSNPAIRMLPLATTLTLLSLPHLVCSCLSFQSVRTPFSARPSSRRTKRRRPSPSLASSGSAVTVYDDVVDEDTCRRLHALTLETTQRSRDGSFLFDRGGPPHERPPLTPLETAIDDILTSLNDTSAIVEYWARKDYINMDAHADVDENTLKDEGVLRCPRWAHVLYLQVANRTDDGGGAAPIAGPTVVFPTRRVAWGSVTSRTPQSSSAASFHSRANLEERGAEEYIVDVENYWDAEQKRQCGYTEATDAADDMVVVPARTGRLLRFPGAAFHAVPRPPERYLLSAAELAAVVAREEEEEDEDHDDYWDDEGDDAEDEDTDAPDQRSVLLFNTWSGAGPRGVFSDRVEDVPDGIAVEGDDATAREDKRRRCWRADYGDYFERVRSNPFARWTEAAVEPAATGGATVAVPLMGNRARRGCAATEAVLHGPVAKSLFRDCRRVSLATLERNQE